MPHVDDITKSKYIAKGDVRTPIVVTICGQGSAQFDQTNGEIVEEITLLFEEINKPLVLKPECAQGIAAFLNEKYTEKWNGKKIELFIDESITFGGKRVGGVRARLPQQPEFNPPDEQTEMPIIDQAFFEYQTVHQNVLPEGFVYIMENFKEAIGKEFGGMPTRKESIPLICEKIAPKDVWNEIPF